MSAKTIFVFAALALAGATVSAIAQDGGSRGVIVQGPRAKMMVVTEAPAIFTASPLNDSGLVTIFDSIAGKYPKGRYWCCTGYGVLGPNQGMGEQWMGGGFTPNANHTVTRIEVAVGWSGGTNGVVISLNADNNGVPGTALKTWNISNLPKSGGCCTVVAVTDKSGIPVSAGQQYWIVLSTNAKENDTMDAWNVSDADQIDNGSFAVFASNTWSTFQTAPGLAFAVKGSN